MVDNGYLSEEEAMLSTSRNLITRALGIAPEVEVDVTSDELDDEDIYILCSDGLSDMVNDADIRRIVTEYRPNLEKAAEALVNQANQNGGSDNISVILVAMHEAFSDERGLPPGASQEIETETDEQNADKEDIRKKDDDNAS
jgi:protein phosphatase